MKLASLRRLTALGIIGISCMAVMPGCYKTEMETQKARADKAEQDLAAATTKSESLQKQVESLRVPAMKYQQVAQGAKLGVYVNGAKIGTEDLRWDDTRGEFVRNGSRVRSTSVVRFENGRLSDQLLKVNRESGKPLVEGQVKNSRPDGDWIWYDAEGRPSIKEVWKDGKLDGLFQATISKPKAPTTTKPAKTPTTKPAAAKPGTTPATPAPAPAPATTTTAVPAGPNTLPTGETITWKPMTKQDIAERVRKTVATFAALPELIRE